MLQLLLRLDLLLLLWLELLQLLLLSTPGTLLLSHRVGARAERRKSSLPEVFLLPQGRPLFAGQDECFGGCRI